MKKYNKKITALVVFYILTIILLYVYYYINQPKWINLAVSAVSDSGEVTFRGITIDGEWYNPTEVIEDAMNWAGSNEMYTAVDETPLYLKLPAGKEYSITFNVGPEQGIVCIDADGVVTQENLWNDIDIELGRAFTFQISYETGADNVLLNRSAAIIVLLAFLIMIASVFSKKQKTIKKHEKKRNDSIEILRFAVIMCVCIHYYCAYAPGGYLGVDFFFVLSGFLLMSHFRNMDHSKDEPVIAAENYTKGRYKRLIPFYLFAFMLAILLNVSLWQPVTVGSFINNNISELLMLEGFGLSENLLVGPGWFCSSLLISGFLIYILLVKNEKLYLKCIAPFALLVIFSWMFRRFGTLNRWLQYDSFISTGTLRGFAEMGLGCICFDVFTRLKESLKGKFRMISSFIELVCIGYIGYIILNYGNTSSDFMCVLFMAVLITSFFIGNSFLADFLNNKISGYLGKISLAIYLNHMILGKIDWFALLRIKWELAFVAYLLIVVIFSAVSTEFVNLLINSGKRADIRTER